MQNFPIRETQLANGPMLMTHAMPESQSVALGIFINTGSRDESANEAGVSHALEHMLFKGTARHDVHTLSEMLDGLGGNANAFTSRERTCFHIRVLHEDWPEAMDLLAEMVLQSTMPAEEWAREKEVIFSEMAMVEDTPDEWVMDEHIKALYPGHSLGAPTLGTRPVLTAMGRDDLAGHHQRYYHASRMLVAASGRIEHEALRDKLSQIDWPQAGNAVARQPAEMANGVQMLPRASEQAHIIMTYPGIVAASDERPVAWLANQILGGGMSSRLFREVREKLGLAYSIASCLSSVSDAGTWTIGCSTEPQHLAECTHVVRRTLDEFRHALDAGELERGKRQLEVQFRMAMDSVDGNMLNLGSRFDEVEVLPQSAWVERILAVEMDQLHDWIGRQLAAPCLQTFSASEEVLMQASGDLQA